MPNTIFFLKKHLIAFWNHHVYWHISKSPCFIFNHPCHLSLFILACLYIFIITLSSNSHFTMPVVSVILHSGLAFLLHVAVSVTLTHKNTALYYESPHFNRMAVKNEFLCTERKLSVENRSKCWSVSACSLNQTFTHRRYSQPRFNCSSVCSALGLNLIGFLAVPFICYRQMI